MRAHFGVTEEGPFAALSEDGRVVALVHGTDALADLDAALAEAGRETKDLTTIAVHEGPSGFSEVRKRIAAANALSFALQIPVAAVGAASPEAVAALSADAFKDAPIQPLYAGAPNITKSKKRSPLWNAR